MVVKMPRTVGTEWVTNETSGEHPNLESSCTISGSCWCENTLYALTLLAREGWCVAAEGVEPDPEEPLLESMTTYFGSSFFAARGASARSAPVGKHPGQATFCAFSMAFLLSSVSPEAISLSSAGFLCAYP